MAHLFLSIQHHPVLLFFMGIAVCFGFGLIVWGVLRHVLVLPLIDQVERLRDDGFLLTERTRQLTDLQGRYDALDGAFRRAENQNAEVRTLLASERTLALEKEQIFLKTRTDLENAFKALSADALEKNNQHFLQLARLNFEQLQAGARHDFDKRHTAFQDMVTPIHQTLHGVDVKLGELEKIRTSAYEGLHHQVRDLIASQKELRTETGHLVKALRTPHIRGRWGEIQLKRVVEMSGMSPHCDFLEQTTVGEDGRHRPDMVIYLPSKKRLVIDAKTPLAAYLDAMEEPDESIRIDRMRAHARHVRTHIMALSSRQYWDQFNDAETPEFVVMFLPGDPFLNSALEYDPTLLEVGVERKVILATPTTLIALLHAIAYGWRSESLEENAKEISALGRELYKRLSDMAGHFARVGQSLSGAMKSYNSAVGSLESRVLPSARRFKDLNAAWSQDVLEVLPTLHHTVRDLSAPEFLIKNSDEPKIGSGQGG